MEIEIVEVYFRGVDEEAVTAILETEAKPYKEDIGMAVINPGLLGRLKDTRYTRRFTENPFAVGRFYYHEVGGPGTEQFVPKINLEHPVKGRVRFTTQTASELLTYGLRTSEELEQADDRILIDEDDPIRSAFSGYETLCGSDFPMVVYKGPRILKQEKELKG